MSNFSDALDRQIWTLVGEPTVKETILTVRSHVRCRSHLAVLADPAWSRRVGERQRGAIRRWVEHAASGGRVSDHECSLLLALPVDRRSPHRVEGGDVVVTKDHVFIGYYDKSDYRNQITARTNKKAIKIIKELIKKKEVIPIELIKLIDSFNAIISAVGIVPASNFQAPFA